MPPRISRGAAIVAIMCGCAWAGFSAAAAAGSYLRRLFSGDAHVPCLIHNLASADECARIVEDAEARGFARSTVVHDSRPISTGRSSSCVFLNAASSEAVGALLKRVSRLLGIPTTHFENVQVARYEAGEKYDAHYDATRISATNTQADLPRMYTVLVYLNDGFQGGHTVFPNCGADVTPRQGMGVLWRNLDDAGKTLQSSYHAGCPVESGTKYVCTLWIHGTPIQQK